MYEFYVDLLNDPQVFLIILLAVSGTLLWVFKKHIYSVFDPLVYFIIITEGFCITDVLFMKYFGLINQKYFWSYLLTEAGFLVGLLQFKPVAPAPVDHKSVSIPLTLKLLYRVSLICYIILNLFVYFVRGIPLFMDSRLETYTIGGGWGLVTRIMDIALVINIYYLLDILRLRKWQMSEWLAILSVIIIQILSGAKSAVLTVVFIVFLHAFFNGTWNQKKSPSKGLLKKMFAVSVVGFLFIAVIQRSDKEVAGRQIPVIAQVALRFVNNGDSLIYAYPDQFIEHLDSSNPVGAVFREYFGFLRIASPNQLPQHLGVQIARAFIGPNAETQTNAKHNLFGYVYFGFFGAILYSYTIGTLLGFCRVRLLRELPRNFQSGLIYIMINLSVLPIASELDFFNRGVIGIFLIYIPVFLYLKIQLAGRFHPASNSGKTYRSIIPTS